MFFSNRTGNELLLNKTIELLGTYERFSTQNGKILAIEKLKRKCRNKNKIFYC